MPELPLGSTVQMALGNINSKWSWQSPKDCLVFWLPWEATIISFLSLHLLLVKASRFFPSNRTMASSGAGVRWQLPSTCLGWGRSESWTCHSVPGIIGVFLNPCFLPLAAEALSAVRLRRPVRSSFFKALSLILGSFHWARFFMCLFFGAINSWNAFFQDKLLFDFAEFEHHGGIF